LIHGFFISPFVILTPPCNNRHARIPHPFHVCAPCLWPIRCVKHILLPCCGMAAQRLNCSYKCRWNEALHCGHLLTTIKAIRHCGYMCWQVPKIHAPYEPNGEQQIEHSSLFCMKGWGVGQKSSLVFSDKVVTYSQSSSRCVT